TIPSTPGWPRKIDRTRSRSVRPPRRTNAFGIPDPSRSPRPAATTMTRTLIRPGARPSRVKAERRRKGTEPASDLEDLVLLVLREVVDLPGVEVRLLLHLVQGPLLVVLGDRLVLEKLLEMLVGVPPLHADGGAAVLGDLVHALRQL